MSNPEISRRCATCGAAVRQRAVFCPQCGGAVGGKSQPESFDPNETIAESRDAQTSVEKSQPTRFDPSVTQPIEPGRPRAETSRRPESTVDEKAQTQALSASPAKKPAGPAAKKVGKFKKVSSVVLDQAAYDPSVRFLLVAAGLFMVFIVLLVLSKVLG